MMMTTSTSFVLMAFGARRTDRPVRRRDDAQSMTMIMRVKGVVIRMESQESEWWVEMEAAQRKMKTIMIATKTRMDQIVQYQNR
jgi:hypothetical protein